VLDTLAKPLTELFVVSLLRNLNESQLYNLFDNKLSNKRYIFKLLILEIGFQVTMNLCEVSKDPKVFNVILVLTKIFYSLNYQVNEHIIIFISY